MGTIIGNNISLQFSGGFTRTYTGPAGNSWEIVGAVYLVDVADFTFSIHGAGGNDSAFLNNIALTFADLGTLPDFTSVTVGSGSVPFTWDANSITMNVSNLSLTQGKIYSLTIGFSPTDIALTNSSVNENTVGRVVVGTLSNDDFDRTTTSYSIADNPYFELVGNQIVLKSGMLLDHEAMSSYNVSITATDPVGARDSVTKTFTIAVNDINEAPSLTASAVTSTFTENGAAVDLFDHVTIGTVESGQSIRGLSLVVSGLDAAGDSLLIDGTHVSLTGGTTGTTFTHGVTYSVSRMGGVATVTLTSSVGLSVAQAEALIDGLAYGYTSDNPGSADRVVTLTSIRDSGGTADGGIDTRTLAVSTTVHVAPVNDAPDGADKTIVVEEDTPYSFATADFGFNDVLDGNGLLGVKITTLPTSGTLLLTDTTGGSAAPVAVAQGAIVPEAFLQFLTWVPDENANGAGLAGFTFQVIDDGDATGGLNVDATPNRITFDVTAVNDAPTEITITPLAPTGDQLASVRENVRGAVIADLDTADIDDSRFVYSVDDNRFEVVNNALKLKAGVALDHEAAATITVEVTSMDSGGLTVTRDVTIVVTDDTADNNSAPVVSSPNPDVTVDAGTALSLSIGDGHFLDAEGTDLDYSVTVNGGVRPAWLTFDAETGLLTGDPTGAEAGSYVIAVTANDGTLYSVADEFILTVTSPVAPPDTVGTRGRDILIGDDSDNIIDGPGGNDRLTGNGGADTFVFGQHYGRDVITDFNPEEGDRIDLSDAVGIRGFRDLMQNHVFDAGENLKIRADDGSVLIVHGIEPGELTRDMFLF